MQTGRNLDQDRDRLSEEAPSFLRDGAIVGSHGNKNYENAAEMTASAFTKAVTTCYYNGLIGGSYLQGKEFDITEPQIEQQLQFNVKFSVN